MTSVPPPQGMSEVDYEAIEAAVTETVRGRWFLAEFARRNRMGETRQLLEAMARIEAVVAAGQVALPSADPSIRLLLQRIKEVAGQLGTVAVDMRQAGVDETFVAAVDLQARAVSALMRNAVPARDALPAASPAPAREARAPTLNPQIAEDAPPIAAKPPPRMPRADLPPMLAPSPAAAEDPRRAALSALDGMTLAKKLALFG